MSKHFLRVAVCSLLFVMAGHAQNFAPHGQKKPADWLDVHLKNGLRVIVEEDHRAPVYGLAVVYDVGSRNEVPGRTGFAHLFEHMMYEGSANVGKGEQMILVQENGGVMNGNTTQDRTSYYEELPANQLDLGLFLESDRMRALNVTQQNLDNQRNAVQEERRLRIDNQPYGVLFELLPATVFDNFAYKHSLIGSMADLNAATLQDVQQFFHTFYAPNNATIALVGDFDQKTALAKIRKYFEDIPRQPTPKENDYSEPPQTAERRATVEDPFASQPMVTIAFKTVAANTADYYALDTLMSVLGGGKASRLYQALVKEKQLATSVSAGMQSFRGQSLATVRARPRPGVDLAQIEKAIYAEIDRAKKEAPADWEMEQAQNQPKLLAANYQGISLGRAMNMARDAVFFNEPGLLFITAQKYGAVKKGDVMRVAAEYLTENKRSVITVLPKAKPASSPTDSK